MLRKPWDNRRDRTTTGPLITEKPLAHRHSSESKAAQCLSAPQCQSSADPPLVLRLSCLPGVSRKSHFMLCTFSRIWVQKPFAEQIS